MKKFSLILSASALLFFAACSGDSKNEGGDQVKEPVMNSGANTEGDRAKDAVSDSADAGSDSVVHKDKDAMSTPH
jgi:hypothetical protein